MTKQELRVDLQTKRQQLELDHYLQLSKKITDRIIREILISIHSLHVFIGLAEKREINTLPVIIEALKAGKDVWAPVILKNKEMMHGRIKNIDDLEKGPIGLIQPKAESLIPDAELILVPGLGFTTKGDRLGWGKGYYDQFLSTMKADSVFSGLCFDFQIVSHIPADQWDEKMTQIITESGLIYCK